MKREKWDRLASVLAAPPTLTEAFGGGQNAARKSGRRPAMKKNFLKACAVTLVGVMATSGLVFADKMDVSAGTQTSTETVTLYAGNNKVTVALSNENNKNVLPDIDQNITVTPPLPDVNQDVNGDDTTDDDSKPAEKNNTNKKRAKSSGTTASQPEQVSQPEQYEYEEKTVQEEAEDRDASNLTYAQFDQNAITSIDNAESGETVTIKTNLWVSFPKEVLEALKERPDVSVTIDYLYHGVWYTVTIPAGADLDALEDSEGYYGFRYLDQIFGGRLCRVSQ